MTERPFVITGTLTMHIESTEALREFRDLYEQRWPAPPQILIDAVKEFGEERALELDRQAHRRSRTANDSYEDQLEMLVRAERLQRAIEANRAPRDRVEPFSFSLRGWPRRRL